MTMLKILKPSDRDAIDPRDDDSQAVSFRPLRLRTNLVFQLVLTLRGTVEGTRWRGRGGGDVLDLVELLW